jgi:predicted aspartyl protease
MLVNCIMKQLRTAIVALVASVVLVAPAQADPARLRSAITAMDVEALKRESATQAEDVRALAAAIEQSWMRHDGMATARLAEAVAAQTEPSLKAAGYLALMSLRTRRGEFAAAAQAGMDADAIEPLNPSARLAQVFVEALASVPPTRALGDPSGVAPIQRDLAGLMRADITAGAESVAAILDTGANFSTVNESTARRLGLRMLESAVSVGSSSRDAVASRLGVADRLGIGGAQFSDVVFIVLPDADLSFADGAYTIDAILGMPVFLEMKRMAVTKVDGKEVFAFGDEAAEVGNAARNILYSALSPMAQLSIDVAGKPVRLSMLLDSGAQTTAFEGAFAEDAAALLVDAETVTSTRGGAGGMVTSDTTKRLAAATLTLGGKTTTIENVTVHVDGGSAGHGILGLDVFGGGFVIDWGAGVIVPN